MAEGKEFVKGSRCLGTRLRSWAEPHEQGDMRSRKGQTTSPDGLGTGYASILSPTLFVVADKEGFGGHSGRAALVLEALRIAFRSAG